MNDKQAKLKALRSTRKMCSEIVRLQGLDGTVGMVPALKCSNTADVMRALANGFAATAAGDIGAFNVWKVGLFYHCEMYRCAMVKDRLLTNLYTPVRRWVDRTFLVIDGVL